jgi:hypothetical protein
MNVILLKALVALVPSCMLFSGAVALFLGEEAFWCSYSSLAQDVW